MDKFKNKYRIQSARLQNWDYGRAGSYFITICTKHRKKYFGAITAGEMHANEMGSIVNNEWMKTPAIRPDMNLELGEFIVMPNHFHAIITLGENEFNSGQSVIGRDTTVVETPCMVVEKPCMVVETPCMASLPRDWDNDEKTEMIPCNKFGPQSKNLGSIIRGFKSAVTTNIRKFNPEFEWQERFHDHIIRNRDEYLRISEYILNNPRNWKDDDFYVD